MAIDTALMTDKQNERHANITYRLDVAAFHRALGNGEKELAHRLARIYNWSNDQIVEQLHAWFEQK